MDKIFSIAFKINGELSGSFGAAIAAAQKQMQNLNRRMSADAQRNLSQAARAAQNLEKLYAMKNAFDQYKKLNQSVQDNSLAFVQARLKSAQMKQAYQDQYKTVEKMRQSYDRLKAVYKDNQRSMSADQRVGMQASIRAAQEELKAQEQILADSKKRWQGSESKSFKLGEQLSRQRSELASLQASLRSAGANLSDMAAQESRLRAEIERTTQALERQQRLDMHRQNFANAQTNLSNASSNFQDAMSTAGTIMSPIKAAVDEAVDFEAAMSKVKALTQVKNIRAGDFATVEKEMAEMTAEIQKVAATSEFSQVEVAQMAQKYAMSGWKPEQITAALQPVINLATATGERDVVKIADMVSDEMQALNLKAGGTVNVGGKNYDAMQHMTDVFAYATNQSNVDASAFHEAMKYNAPIATAAGVNMHEIAALNMVMANSAIKGSMGGTAGRSGILRLVAPPKQAAKALEELGMSASDAQKAVAEAGAEMQSMGINEFDSVTTKIQKIQQSLQGLSDQEKTAKLGKIFGTNGASGWAAIMAHYDDYIKYMKDFDSGAVAGWTDDTAAVMRDNTATQFKLLESAVSALATTFGSLFLPALTKGVSMLTQFASGLQQWVQEHQTAAQWIGIIAAGLSTVIVLAAGAATAFAAWSFVTSGISAMAAAITGLSIVQRAAAGASMAFAAAQTVVNAVMMMNPVGLAVAAFLALGAAILYVVNCCPNLSAALSAAWNDPQGAVHGFATLLKNSINDAVNYVLARWETLKSALSNPIDAVLNFMDHGDVIGGKVQAGESVLAGQTAASGGGNFGTPQPQQVDNSALIAAIANAVENTQRQNSDADLSKVTAAISTAVESIKQDPKTDIAPLLQQVSTAIESTKQEQPELDFTPITEAIAATQAAQAEQKAIETETTQQNLNNVGQAAEQTASQLQGTQGNIQAFDAALPQPIGNLGTLSDSSGAAAGSLQAMADAAGAVASALSAKAAEIGSIKISVPQISAAPVAQNFAGGIYSKGAFLTTFAEKSPEAAIPIDKSQRAIDLWTKTGQLLGLLPGNSTAIESAPTAQKMTTLERAQRQRLEQVKAQYEAAKKAGALNSTAIEYDELGNIKGLNGLKDNVITKDDDIQVARAKKSAQMAEWRKTHSTQVESLPKTPANSADLQKKLERLKQAGKYLPTTPPFVPDSTQVESPRSIFSGRRNLPDMSNIPMTQTQPRNYDTGLNIGDIFGGIGERTSGGMLTGLLNNLPQQSESSPIDLHFEINIQGNANAEDVEQGIRQSIPMLEETFERKLANYRHEEQRRSF